MQSKSQNKAGMFAQRFDRWLDAVGLQFDPFDRAYLDSGADANLHTYLVGHDAFAAIWHDSPSYVFAPIGGGKTAFRVRLTRACRVGEDDRHVFPVVYKMTSPDELQTSSNALDPHLVGISRGLVSELLLTLAYRPERYFALNRSEKASVRHLLQFNHVPNLNLRLQQLIDKGSLSSLVDVVDPTADQLFAQPDPPLLRQLCSDLLQDVDKSFPVNRSTQKNSPARNFAELTAILRSLFRFEAVYILIDSVDANVETKLKPASIVQWLGALVEQSADWANQQIYTKFFLPDYFTTFVKVSELFTSEITTIVNVKWTKEKLDQALRERLLAASDGRFDSLDALCGPSLRNSHKRLLEVAKPLPREVMLLTGNFLREHVQRTEDPDLELEDLERAEAKYYEETKQVLRVGGNR